MKSYLKDNIIKAKSLWNINFCFWSVFNNKRLFTKKNTHIPKPNRGNRYVKKTAF